MFEFFEQSDDSEQEQEQEPVVSYKIGEFFQANDNIVELARVVLLMTEVLLLYHAEKIIHGDICEDKFAITIEAAKVTVKLLESGCSRAIDDEEVAFVTDENENPHWAPERRGVIKGPPPAISQDVYSFGDTLRWLFFTHSRKVSQLLGMFPFMREFISNALNKNPDERPSLILFYSSLLNQLMSSGHIEELCDYNYRPVSP